MLRREVLKAALPAAAVFASVGLLGACAHRPQPLPPSQRRPVLVPQFSGLAPGILWRTLSARFEGVAPGVTLGWYSGGVIGALGLGLVTTALSPAPPGYQRVTLPVGLVDVSGLIPGLLDPFRAHGGYAALPVTLSPTGIQYNPQVAAAPPGAPHPGWTIQGFEEACAWLSAAEASGRSGRGVLTVVGLEI